MLNKVLRKKLESYYYNGEYGNLPDGLDVANAHGKIYGLVEGLGLDYDEFCEIEDAISRTEVESELQGFLRGYEYCLTMMGLMKEGEK